MTIADFTLKENPTVCYGTPCTYRGIVRLTRVTSRNARPCLEKYLELLDNSSMNPGLSTISALKRPIAPKNPFSANFGTPPYIRPTWALYTEGCQDFRILKTAKVFGYKARALYPI